MQSGRYEGSLYPSYCSGTFFVVPKILIKEIYYMMLDTPSFMPDDAWLGIVYEKLGVSIRDAHTHFAGITSYKRELRLFNYATSDKFYNNEVFVTILDYAFKHEKIASKIIQLWSVINTEKRVRGIVHKNTGGYLYYMLSLAVVLLIVLASSSVRKWFCGKVFHFYKLCNMKSFR